MVSQQLHWYDHAKNLSYLFFGFIFAGLQKLFLLSGISHTIAETLVWLLVFDTITGSIASVKIGKEITSSRGIGGIFYKLLLLVVPVAVALVMRIFGIPFQITINGALSIIALYELYSILGNCYTIKTGIELPEQDTFSIIIKWFMGKIELVLKKLQ